MRYLTLALASLAPPVRAMNIKNLLLTAGIGLTMIATTTQARLGWTLEKCREFYGPDNGEETTATGSKFHSFHKSGIRICIFFTDDKAVEMEYDYRPKGYFPSSHEIYDLLDKNKLDAEWSYEPFHKTDENGKFTVWLAVAQNHIKLAAEYQKLKEGGMLLIMLQSQYEKEQERDSSPDL